MALTPGTRLGAYEIVAPIGAGGMGEVYRATDTNLKRAVAIKVLSDALASDDERLARFRREAEVLASLNHPNIAAIYGLERSADRTALVMELVEGPTLADRIVQGPIPFDEALPIAKQIAEALEAAHEQGIIHRDLKPANIKLRPDGVVKVLDFGLAKAMEAVGSSTANATSSPTITSPALMTGVGMLLGTAGYMSPEQAHGRSADRRADIFSFGAVLYELLSGRRAFTGESVSDTLASVLKIEPDWSALPADVPEVIRRLLRRCLTKDRRLRLQAIGEARIVFESPVDMMPGGEGIAVARKTLLWKRVFPVLAGAAVSALLVGGVIWSLRPEPATPSITTFSVMLPEGQRFTNVGRLLLAVSPDGTRIVYIANRRLYPAFDVRHCTERDFWKRGSGGHHHADIFTGWQICGLRLGARQRAETDLGRWRCDVHNLRNRGHLSRGELER